MLESKYTRGYMTFRELILLHADTPVWRFVDRFYFGIFLEILNFLLGSLAPVIKAEFLARIKEYKWYVALSVFASI